ncbi:MAG: hypothetical protein R6V01_05020 [Thermoplasmatota archaeon]
MAWDWNTFWFVLIIGLLVILLALTIIWFINLSRKKRKGPSHVELYFSENFRKIMDEWDFSTRDQVKDFKSDMKGRLKKVGGDIDLLESKKGKLDRRMSSLDKKMQKLEGL